MYRTHTPRSLSETGEIWIRSVDCIKVSILGVILCYSFTNIPSGGNWANHTRNPSLYYCLNYMRAYSYLNTSFHYERKGKTREEARKAVRSGELDAPPGLEPEQRGAVSLELCRRGPAPAPTLLPSPVPAACEAHPHRWLHLLGRP